MNLSVPLRGPKEADARDLSPKFIHFRRCVVDAPRPPVHRAVDSGKLVNCSIMAQRFPAVYWSVLAAGLLAVVLAGTGCERRTSTRASSSAGANAGPTPTHVSWDAQFMMSEGGRPRAVIAAQRMEQYRVSDSTYSVWRSMHDTARVQLQLYDQQGDSSATVTADSLVFQERKGILDAYRNVVVVTETNKRLQTEHLTWRQADRTIRTRRFVRIRTPTEVVQGNGLVADEDLETYQIGQFEAEVEVDDAASGEDE